MLLDGHTFLNVDAAHIRASSPRLLAASVEVPEALLLVWDDAVNRLAAEQRDLLAEVGLEAWPDALQVRLGLT